MPVAHVLECREPVFLGAEGYRFYRRLIATAARRGGAEIWAYWLMPNHVHLIVTPADRNGLRRTFDEAHRRYTGAINARVPLDRPSFPGSLWRGGDGRAAPVGGGTLTSRSIQWSRGWCAMPGTGHGRASARISRARITSWQRWRRCALIPDFAALLAAPTDPATTAPIERAPTIRRPLGAPEWIAALERPLAPGKPGPKPRVDREPERQQRLL